MIQATGQVSEQAWMIRDETRKVMAALTASGVPARFVGGCVRNTLLNTDVYDVDIATPLVPDEVIELLDRAKIKNVPTGIDHGTVTAIVDGTPFEITTLRKDVETHGRRATVAYTDDWLEDAARRDFTMNALYMDPDGTLYDPFGGVEDLRRGCVKFVGSAEERITEDVLRILRFFRFFAHYGSGDPDEDALSACKKLAHLIPGLSGERIRDETLKLLKADNAPAVWSLMRDAGILGHFLPEAAHVERLERLIKIEKEFDIPNPLRRLIVLLPEAGAEGAAEAAAQVSARLRLSNAQKKQILYLVENTFEIRDQTEKKIREQIYFKGRSNYIDMILVRAAQEGSPDMDGIKKAYLMAESWVPPDFPLNGTDVMKLGVPAGPEVGKILAEIETWWAGQDFTPGREACLKELQARGGRAS